MLAIAGALGPWWIEYTYEPRHYRGWPDASICLTFALLAFLYLLFGIVRNIRRRWADVFAALGLVLTGTVATIDHRLVNGFWHERYATGVTDPTWGIAAVMAGGFGGAIVFVGFVAGLGMSRRGDSLSIKGQVAHPIFIVRWLCGVGLIVGILGPWEVDRVHRFGWTLEARVTGAVLPEGTVALAFATLAVVLSTWRSRSRSSLSWRLGAAFCFGLVVVAAGWAWMTLESTTSYGVYQGVHVFPGWGLPVSIVAGGIGAATCIERPRIASIAFYKS